MPDIKRVCFCCGKKLKSSTKGTDEIKYPPLDATSWESYGNYGSKVFDPMDGSNLELYICDGCLVKGKRRLNRVITTEHKVTSILRHPNKIFDQVASFGPPSEGTHGQGDKKPRKA